MGNAQIPKRADLIDEEFGISADGLRVEAVVFQHTPLGHAGQPVWWIVQYRRDTKGRIDRGARVTRQYTGPNAEKKMRRDFEEARALLLDSRKKGTR